MTGAALCQIGFVTSSVSNAVTDPLPDDQLARWERRRRLLMRDLKCDDPTAALLYGNAMSDEKALSISEARDQLSVVVDRARAEHRPVFLSRRGRRIAAVIDADDLDRLIGLAEDMADIRAAAAARAEMVETGATPIPWDEVKAELGL